MFQLTGKADVKLSQFGWVKVSVAKGGKQRQQKPARDETILLMLIEINNAH